MEQIAEKLHLSFNWNTFLDKLVDLSTTLGTKLLAAIFILLIGRWIIRRLKKLINNLLEKRQVEASLATFTGSLINITLNFLLVLMLVGTLGVETSSIIALFASIGVGIGMALSGTLQNFAGGVLILLLKPFKVGDTIEAQGFTGTVKKIEIFNTMLTTPDNKSIIIPNGGLSTGAVNNYSTQSYRRIDWTVSISYGDDFAKASEVLLQMLAEDSRVIQDVQGGVTAAPMARLAKLNDSSVDLTVRAWVASADYWNVFFDFNEKVYATLPERAGVSFPYPQLDVHVTR